MLGNSTWVILVAGGVGKRFGAPQPKQFLKLKNQELLEYSLSVFSQISEISGVVLVVPEGYENDWSQRLAKRSEFRDFRVVVGGQSRQESTARGLEVVPETVSWVLVHDAARPFVDAEMTRAVLAAAQESGAAIVAVPVADTLKSGSEAGFVTTTVARDGLFQVQTPQAFRRSLLREALVWAGEQGLDATDEATLIEKLGHPVRLVPGSRRNFKITQSEDLELARAMLSDPRGGSMFRIGEGYDVHRYVSDRPLILGGVTIPFELGLLGHSDADALSHAIADAFLGAAALGDLGAHFPDSDPAYRGISSLKILREVRSLLEKKGFQPVNLDATLVCQKPKLAPHVPAMRQNLAEALDLPLESVSVKATTEEGLGFTGTLEGLAARAVVLIQPL